MNIDLRIVKPVYGTEGKKYEGFINGFELESSCGTINTIARMMQIILIAVIIIVIPLIH